VSQHLRFFRRLVRILLPDDFRADYGRDMERTFRAQQREAAGTGGAAAVARLWVETLIGLLRTAPREHAAQLRQDVRYALRTMRRAPGFTAVALVTLATGMGAATAMFSVAHAVLLRPLPYADAASLAMLWNRWPGSDRAGLSRPEVLDFRERLRSVHFAAFADGFANLVSPGEPERLRGSGVSPNPRPSDAPSAQRKNRRDATG
jgi:putative ABC transport system permease protein